MSVIEKVSLTEGVALIAVTNLENRIASIARVLKLISDNMINIDMICKTAQHNHTIDLYFTVSEEHFSKALSVLGAFQKECPGIRTDVNLGNAKIVLYGAAIVDTIGVAAQVFDRLKDADMEIKLITTSDVDISILVSSADANEAYDLLDELM